MASIKERGSPIDAVAGTARLSGVEPESRARVPDARETMVQKGLGCAHGEWGGVRSLVARLAWGEERGQ